MRNFNLKFLMVLLSVVSFCLSSQAFAGDDFDKAAESLAKLYKIDELLNERLFGSFAATDAPAGVSPKNIDNDNKSGSSGFKIRGLKRLQYKVDQNQILNMQANGLSYVFRFQF